MRQKKVGRFWRSVAENPSERGERKSQKTKESGVRFSAVCREGQ